MLNPERSFELNNLSIEQNINKIIEEGGVDHTPMDYFKSLEGYGTQEIEKDESILESAYKRINNSIDKLSPAERKEYEKGKERGEALEITLTYLLERWFETEDIEVLTQRTTEFDDVVNGTDIIVEFKTPDSIEKVALAIDASLSVKNINEKLNRCHRKMTGKEGDFQVKYFQSQFENEEEEFPHGPIKNLISLVSGLDAKNANKLFDDFAEYLSIRKRDFNESEKKMEKMANDSIKKIFLLQLKEQINFYKTKSDLKPGILDELEKISIIFEEIEASMDSIVCDFRQKGDKVLEEVINFTKGEK